MRRRTRMVQLAGSVGIAVFSALSVGHAQPSPPAASPSGTDDVQVATNAFWEGKRLYDSGQFEQALNQFAAAYRLVEDPTLLYNIAQSYRQLGDCDHAKDAYAQFRALSPASPLVEQADGHLADLERTCPIASPPHEAQSTAHAPQTTEHRNEPAIARTPELPGVATAAKTPAPQGAATPPSATEASRRPARLAPAPKPIVGETRLYLTLASLAAGLVAGGTAVGLGFWNRGRHEQWEAQDASLAKGNAGNESDSAWASRQQSNDELSHSIARTGRLVGYLGATSGALLVGSALLFFTAPQSTRTPTTARMTGNTTWCIPTVLGLNNYHLLVQTPF